MIDTFQLHQDCQSTDYLLTTIKDQNKIAKLHVHGWQNKTNMIEAWKGLPKFFKVYEINENDLYKSFDIHVENSNSNATNGFMTKSSMIKFSLVSLIPSVLLKGTRNSLLDIISKLTKGLLKHRKRNATLYSRNNESSNPQADHTLCWPIAETFLITENNNKRKNTTDYKIRDSATWIGGSFTAQYLIKKKHKIKFLGRPEGKNKGFIRCVPAKTLTLALNKDLLNIYNENQ